MINTVLLKHLSVICLPINNKVLLFLHNDSLFDDFKEIIFKIMASVSVGERKESLSVLLWERIHENLGGAGLKENVEGIYGVLKMKHECMPEEVLIHIN